MIQQGAKLVTTSEDIIEEMEPIWGNLSLEKEAKSEDRSPLPPLKEEEKKIYDLLSDEPEHIDSLIGGSGFLASRVSSILLMLQMKKLITELPGKMFVR